MEIMEPAKITGILTDEIIKYFDLPRTESYDFINQRLDWVLGIGFNIGRTHGVNTFHKPVVKYTDEKGILQVYESIKAAANANDIHQSNISRVCLGQKKTAGGFKWKYLNPNDYYKNRRIQQL